MSASSQLPARNSRLLETEIGNPPSSMTSGGLPDDLLQQAAHRLGLICAVIAGMWIAELLLFHLVAPPTTYPDTAIFRLFEIMGAITLAVSPALDELVLECLNKKPFDRPAGARELSDRLRECAEKTGWTRKDATRWWENESYSTLTI